MALGQRPFASSAARSIPFRQFFFCGPEEKRKGRTPVDRQKKRNTTTKKNKKGKKTTKKTTQNKKKKNVVKKKVKQQELRTVQCDQGHSL